jgi:hypothetical protein
MQKGLPCAIGLHCPRLGLCLSSFGLHWHTNVCVPVPIGHYDWPLLMCVCLSPLAIEVDSAAVAASVAAQPMVIGMDSAAAVLAAAEMVIGVDSPVVAASVAAQQAVFPAAVDSTAFWACPPMEACTV